MLCFAIAQKFSPNLNTVCKISGKLKIFKSYSFRIAGAKKLDSMMDGSKHGLIKTPKQNIVI